MATDVLTSDFCGCQVVIDGAFLLDIVLNFRTAYETEDGSFIRNPKTIRTHYLSTWFAVDFVAVLPYSYIVMMIQGGQDDKPGGQGLIKSLRLIRLAKLLRLTKLLPLLRRLDERFEGLLSSVKLISLVVVVCYITHIVACMWFWVGEADFQLPDCVDVDNTSLIHTGQLCTVQGWVNKQHWGPVRLPVTASLPRASTMPVATASLTVAGLVRHTYPVSCRMSRCGLDGCARSIGGSPRSPPLASEISRPRPRERCSLQLSQS